MLRCQTRYVSAAEGTRLRARYKARLSARVTPFTRRVEAYLRDPGSRTVEGPATLATIAGLLKQVVVELGSIADMKRYKVRQLSVPLWPG